MNTLSGYYWHPSQSTIVANTHNIVLQVRNGNIYDQDGKNLCPDISNVVSISDIYSDIGPFEAITADGKVYSCDRNENTDEFFPTFISRIKNIVATYRYNDDYYAPVYLDINNKFYIFVENRYIEFDTQVQVVTFIRTRIYGDSIIYNDIRGNVYSYQVDQPGSNRHLYELKDVIQVVSESIFIHADGTVSVINRIDHGVSGIMDMQTLRHWYNQNIINYLRSRCTLLEPIKIKNLKNIIYGHSNSKDMAVFLDAEGNVYRSRYIYVRNSIQEDIESISKYIEENKNEPDSHIIDFVVKTPYKDIYKVKVIGINTLLLQDKENKIFIERIY